MIGRSRRSEEPEIGDWGKGSDRCRRVDRVRQVGGSFFFFSWVVFLHTPSVSLVVFSPPSLSSRIGIGGSLVFLKGKKERPGKKVPRGARQQ
jgi:hypothetical protein